MAGFLATNVFDLPEAKVLIELASLTIIADSFLKISQSTFIGLEKLEFHSLTLILNASMRCVLAPLLVALGFGVVGAIQGQIVAQLIAGCLGLMIFYVTFLRKSNEKLWNKRDVTKALKTLLKYGLPLSVSVIVAGFLPQFNMTLFTQSYTLANSTGYTTPLGNYQAALNFTVIISFFTVPINTVLFPAFSKLKAEKEKDKLGVVFQSSVKYGALLTLPVTLMIMALAEPLVFAVVGTEYADAPFFLVTYSTIYLFAAIGNLSVPNFLNGQNKTQLTMKMALITLVAGLILGLTAIPAFGVVGLIIANVFAGVPGIFVGLWWVKKYFNATIDWVSSAKIFFASGIAALLVGFCHRSTTATL